MELRHVLKKLMKERGVSVKSLAEVTGVPLGTIKTFLSGSRPRDIRQVLAIARFFEVSLEFMFTGEDAAAEATIQGFPRELVYDGWLKVKIERAIPLKQKK